LGRQQAVGFGTHGHAKLVRGFGRVVGKLGHGVSVRESKAQSDVSAGLSLAATATRFAVAGWLAPTWRWRLGR
jgi:hypothetical protein